MSFGFSVSDFITLGGLALKLYAEFRAGPEACQSFANELLLLHQVLEKLASDLDGNVGLLGPSDHAALKACADSCKELVYVQIYGAICVPTTKTAIKGETEVAHELYFYPYNNQILQRIPQGNDRLLRAWRQKWGERKFAARIPKLQQTITAHVQSLTAFSTLLVRSDQLRIFACQDRLEALHEQTRTYLEDTNASAVESQTRLEAASERLEQSQKIIERQLEGILAFQKRHEPPVLSNSLDASSPEGRETWMNLGRILRAEGITPAMIKQNRDVLVKVMKTTLHEEEWSTTPQSYHTAYESIPQHHRTLTQPSSIRTSAQASLNVLGSAPPKGATFTDDFLHRHHGLARSLEEGSNVDDGMQTLLHSMDMYSKGDEPEGVTDDHLFDLGGLTE